MPYRSTVGLRIRERRRALGITQSALAARVGISASYLNLIESGRRRVGGTTLKRLAGELDVDVDTLDGAAQRRLIDDLASLSIEPLLDGLQLDPDSAERLIGQHEDWARALVKLHRAALDRLEAIRALSDRLNHDPFLGAAVHSMRSRVAAIRSSAEILETIADLEPQERSRFLSIISSESTRLSGVTQALAAFFDQSNIGTRSVMPTEEVDDFLIEQNNHFPQLEQVATDFRAAAGIRGDCDGGQLADWLTGVHDVQIRNGRGETPEAAATHPHAHWDAQTRTLTLPGEASHSVRRFELARLAAIVFHQGTAIHEQVRASPLLTTQAARQRATHVLVSYLAAAILMPYEAILEAATDARYDLDRLMRRFDASFEQICHRLVTLRRPDAAAVPFAFLRVDTAGFITKRYPLPRLLIPRHGSACPLWPVYQAFQSPGAIMRRLVEFPDQGRFLMLARTDEKQCPVHGMPRRLVSVMIACDALHADRTVYGDGIDLSSHAPALPVGSNCRLCTRQGCWYRQEDPIIGS